MSKQTEYSSFSRIRNYEFGLSVRGKKFGAYACTGGQRRRSGWRERPTKSSQWGALSLKIGFFIDFLAGLVDFMSLTSDNIFAGVQEIKRQNTNYSVT